MQASGIERAKEVERYVVLAFDEMKIKEGLVYNKHSGQVVGHTCLEDIHDDLEELARRLEGTADKPTVATHMLSFMIRGSIATTMHRCICMRKFNDNLQSILIHYCRCFHCIGIPVCPLPNIWHHWRQPIPHGVGGNSPARRPWLLHNLHHL